MKHKPTEKEVEALIKASKKVHRLLFSVVPAGKYGSPGTETYKKACARIDRIHGDFDTALADAMGLPKEALKIEEEKPE